MRIARACWVKFEEGATKHSVKAFRKECCQRTKQQVTTGEAAPAHSGSLSESNAIQDLESIEHVQQLIAHYLQMRPSAHDEETEAVTDNSPSHQQEIARPLEDDVTMPSTTVLQVLVKAMAGDIGVAIDQLGLSAETEVARLKAKWSNEGRSEALQKQAAGSSRTVLIIARTMGLLLASGSEAISGDLVKRLLRCILEGIELPPELRKLLLHPLMSVLLTEVLVHHAAAELWKQVEDCLKPGIAEPKQPDWVYAAGCLAHEIENFLSKNAENATSQSRNTMHTLQLAAKLHLSWSGYAGPSLDEPEHHEHAITEEAPPSIDPEHARQRRHHVHHGKGLRLAASHQSLDGDSASDAASRSISSSSVSGDDGASEAGDKLSVGDRASDLEDFIDMSEEHNNYGLLRQADAQLMAGVFHDVEDASAVVKEHYSTQIKPDWQAQCRRLLKEHPPAPGTSMPEQGSSMPSDEPAPKRVRAS